MLAIGRDYTDVAPIDGVIVGSGEQWIDVSVNVEPVGVNTRHAAVIVDTRSPLVW